MHLWDLSAYLPAGHLVIRMDSMGPVPTWRDAAYALDRAGHRSASFGACQGRFEALCTGDVPEPDGPWALRGAGFEAWAWPVAQVPAGEVPASVRSTVEALPPALGSFLLALVNNLRVSLELLDGQGPVDQVPVEQVPGERDLYATDAAHSNRVGCPHCIRRERGPCDGCCWLPQVPAEQADRA